jgi:hypothetical protein
MISVLLAAMIAGQSKVEISGSATWNNKPAGDAVVWLEGGSDDIKPLGSFNVRQKNKEFIPHIGVVPAGTKVSFPNEDTILHNVFAEYNAKKFDLGLFPKGRSKDVTFDKQGLVAVLCNIHPEMSCYLMVVESNYYTKTDKKGAFKLTGVKPGKYTLHVWHESRATGAVTFSADKTQSVTVALKR